MCKPMLRVKHKESSFCCTERSIAPSMGVGIEDVFPDR